MNKKPIIEAEELVKIMHQSNVKIFDVRGKWNGNPIEARSAYDDLHIEGAVFLDWTRRFVEADTPLHLAAVADQTIANQSFEELGISVDDTVVLYDDYRHMLAGRVWWSLRYYGFPKVKVLNGGWKYWKQKQLPVTSEVPVRSKGDFKVNYNKSLRTSMTELIKAKNDVNLIDARGAKGYNGKAEDPRTGHIPGAINIPYTDVLDTETGLFKSEAELRKIFEEKLPDFNHKKVISSCGAGYSGTVILQALMLTGEEAPLFDDSFSVWKLDDSRPVEQGEI